MLNQVLRKVAMVVTGVAVSRKMTDSPGAMLVMPVSESAAAGDSELSSIFHPLMSTARAPVLVTSNQSAR